jgi:hypothetical protein
VEDFGVRRFFLCARSFGFFGTEPVLEENGGCSDVDLF